MSVNGRSSLSLADTTPWATKTVYDDHVAKHGPQHGGNYLEEVRDAYQQVVNQQFGQFQSADRDATINYLGEENNKHKYEVMVGKTARTLVVTEADPWMVVTYHKSDELVIKFHWFEINGVIG